MRAINHLLELPALHLAAGSFALLLASVAAAIIVFMIGFQLAGAPAGTVWVLLGLARTADSRLLPHRAIEEPIRAAGSGETESLASLGENVAAAGAGRKVGKARTTVKK